MDRDATHHADQEGGYHDTPELSHAADYTTTKATLYFGTLAGCPIVIVQITAPPSAAIPTPADARGHIVLQRIAERCTHVQPRKAAAHDSRTRSCAA